MRDGLRFLLLLFQQVVDVLDIVERVVDEELQFGDDAELVALERTQLVADGACLRVDVVEQFLCPGRREDAE
jgi:hypothetical protein